MASLTKLFILILVVSSAQSALFSYHSLRRFDDNLYFDKIADFLSYLKYKMKKAKLFSAPDAKGILVLESLLNQKVDVLQMSSFDKNMKANLQEPWDRVRLYRRSSSYR